MATNEPNYGEQEEEEDPLRCKICREIYTDPVTLLCGDTFCRGCVKDWQIFSLTCVSYHCGVCSEDTCLPEGKVLPTNKALRRQCEKVKQNRQECRSCQCVISGGKKPCKDCLSPFCDRCELTHNCPAQKVKCIHHQKSVKYYCKECSVHCCSICLLDGDHKDHDTEAAITTFNRTFRVLKSDSDKLIRRYELLKEQLEASDRTAGKLEQQLELELETVEELKEQLIHYLDKATEALVDIKKGVTAKKISSKEQFSNVEITGVIEAVEMLPSKRDAAKAQEECVDAVGMVTKLNSALNELDIFPNTDDCKPVAVNNDINNVKGLLRKEIMESVNKGLSSQSEAGCDQVATHCEVNQCSVLPEPPTAELKPPEIGNVYPFMMISKFIDFLNIQCLSHSTLE